MENKAEELRRISNIAKGKIPVSEESAVFELFVERRKICRAIIDTKKEINLEGGLLAIDYYNELIRQCLCL